MTPNEVLKTYWNHHQFRSPQEEIINAILDKKNTIALLPTGGGKSICYQIPAVIQNGIALVISPLLSLMQDQIKNLEKRGIKASYIKSGSTIDEIVTLFDNIKYNNTKLLYLSPERLQSNLIQDKLKELTISFIAVDEAHCISEWGHDFRPSFLAIKEVKNILNNLPIIALTATANKKVLEDIKLQLDFKEVTVFKKSFFRENIAYQIFEIENKNNRLLQIASKIKLPIIVYTNTRKRTKEISDFLNEHNHQSTFYHGGLTREEKETSYNQWICEQKRIIVATNAFGMGIDKDNVSAVVHMDLPYSVENYFQEAGRAGRGGKKSFSALLWNKSDLENFEKQFLNSFPDVNFIKKFTKKLYQFFEIAQGEFSEEIVEFHFLEFCQLHNFHLEKAKNSLVILSNNGLIDVANDFFSSSMVKILVNPNQLYKEKNNKVDTLLLEFLLRNYTGLFSDFIKINEFNIASKLGILSNDVKKSLEKLTKKGIVSYKQNRGYQNLQFLQPREDLYAINRISNKINTYLKQKEYKMKSLLEFITSTNICRSQWLLSYFDEESLKECGICDVCLEKRANVPENLEANILALLKQNHYSSQEIFTLLHTREKWVLESLKNLLKKEIIYINKQNKYGIQ